MQYVDVITSLFQFGAVVFLLDNIRAIIRDKDLKGVSILMIVFFTVWGYWGIFMFYVLQQPLSMWTNIGIAVAYTIWFLLAVFYKSKKQ
jgi:hypothetical protein